MVVSIKGGLLYSRMTMGAMSRIDGKLIHPCSEREIISMVKSAY